MRIILALSLLLVPVAAEESTLAHKFPAGANAYIEVSGLAGKVEAMLDSPLGVSIRNHAAVQFLLNSPKGQKFKTNLKHVENATGYTPTELLKTVFGDRFAVAYYGDKRVLAITRMSAQKAERIVAGIEKILPILQRVEVMPAGETKPALMRSGPVFFFHDGKHLVLSPDRFLAIAVRMGVGDGLTSDPRFVQARTAAAGGTLFGFVDMKMFQRQLAGYEKPKELGQAILLGAFAHYMPKAPWVALRAALTDDTEEGWTVTVEGYVPLPAEVKEPVDASYRGTLKPLPFALPKRTLGLIRMRRNLASIWSSRDALIAPKGIPGLIQFETNFGNLSGGMNWVEEFLPNIGDEFIVLGTRRLFLARKPSPAVRFPQGALLVPMRNLDKLGTKLQVAFNQSIAILNFNQGMMGKPLMVVASDYKGVRVLQADYVGATEGEMEGMKSLPARFNFAPACAAVGEYFVIASHGDIIKELIDNQGKEGPAPRGVNAGLWLKPGEVRILLEENREPLIANAMVEDGIPRAEAEGRIDLLMDIARYIRKFELTSRESRATMGVRFEIGFKAP